MENTEKWEEELTMMMVKYEWKYNTRNEVRDFIKSLLSTQREEILAKVEELKKESEKFVPFQKIHYQSALEDLKQSLKEEGK